MQFDFRYYLGTVFHHLYIYFFHFFAYEAYKLIKEVNQYSIKDLKKVHGVMAYLTIDEFGEYRKGNEGVFDENGNCIHVCSPPEQVDELMKQLFKWMEDNNGYGIIIYR